MKEKVLSAALAGLLHPIQEKWADEIRKSILLPDMEEIFDRASRLASANESASPMAKKSGQKHKLSIFTSLQLRDQRALRKSYNQLKPLGFTINGKTKDPDCPIFPTTDPSEDDSVLWCNLDASIGHLPALERDKLDVYLENVLSILQQYGWCIPVSADNNESDISLYDHCRMTAAISSLLVEADSDNPNIALLVGGDVSGIQDFIYAISSKGATSALRGRSFYLQMVCDLIPRYILRRLELPITNLIYTGGGGFYMLVRPGDEAKLVDIQRDISRILFNQHGSDLYLAIAWQPLTEADFFHGGIGRRWKDLGDKMAAAKMHRFAELGNEIKTIFEPQGHGGNEEEQCQVCHSDLPRRKNGEKEKQDEEKESKCPACWGYEELGRNLRKANYLVISISSQLPAIPSLNPVAETKGWKPAFAAFGYELEIMEDLPNLSINKNQLVFALNDPAYASLRPTSQLVAARKFLVNATPTNSQGDILSFEDLEKAEDRGIQRLGVLRMDVDDLGKLFAEGFPEETRSLTRVASLSFAISLFFEGYLGTLAQKHPDKVYSIYSGGDDLFFVGCWSHIVELAREIRLHLGIYASFHPAIHLSGGMVLIGGKYPLSQAAQDADHAEKQAKNLSWKWGDQQDPDKTGDASAGSLIIPWQKDDEPHKKDAFCFLGQALPWHRFGLEECDHTGTGTAHGLMHQIVDTLPESIQMPLVRRLSSLSVRFSEAWEERKQAGRDRNKEGKELLPWGPWIWLGFYSLTRMAKQIQSQDIQGAGAILSLRDELKNNNYHSIEWMGLAARWAELVIQKTNDSHN